MKLIKKGDKFYQMSLFSFWHTYSEPFWNADFLEASQFRIEVQFDVSNALGIIRILFLLPYSCWLSKNTGTCRMVATAPSGKSAKFSCDIFSWPWSWYSLYCPTPAVAVLADLITPVGRNGRMKKWLSYWIPYMSTAYKCMDLMYER